MRREILNVLERGPLTASLTPSPKIARLDAAPLSLFPSPARHEASENYAGAPFEDGSGADKHNPAQTPDQQENDR